MRELHLLRGTLSALGWNAKAAAERNTSVGEADAPASARPREGQDALALGQQRDGLPAAVPQPVSKPPVLAEAPALGVWTAQRRQWGAEMYAAGLAASAMLPLLNRLPGWPIASDGAVKAQAKALKWRREIDVSFGLGAAQVCARNLCEWQSRRGAAFEAGCGEVAESVAEPKPSDDAVVVRSNARPAVVLPGCDRRVPSEPAPFRAQILPELVERDGSFSPARRQIAEDRLVAVDVPITLTDAMLWGANNGIVPLNGERPSAVMARVNAHRHTLRLPAFRVIPARSRLEPLPEPKVGGNYDGEAAAA